MFCATDDRYLKERKSNRDHFSCGNKIIFNVYLALKALTLNFRARKLFFSLTEADFAARTQNGGRCNMILGQSSQAEAVAVVERVEDVYRRGLHGVQTTDTAAKFPVR